MEMVYTLDEITTAADWFLAIAGDRKVFAFHGEMGSGKTTFISTLCTRLQITGAASSPTYAIINSYTSGPEIIYHIDLYRLHDEAEAIQAGVEDCLYSGKRCFVEWPEKAPGLFPAGTVEVYFETINEWKRRITIGDN